MRKLSILFAIATVLILPLIGCATGYTQAELDIAYERGYEKGLHDGYETGYDVGYEYGEEIGYQYGYDAGCEYCYDVGYEDGHRDGDAEGRERGYEQGRDIGYQQGYEVGYEAGCWDWWEQEAIESSPLPKRYVGSIDSNIYHYPDCIWALNIKPQNEIWFYSVNDADAHGYRPCKVCNPPPPNSPWAEADEAQAIKEWLESLWDE